MGWDRMKMEGGGWESTGLDEAPSLPKNLSPFLWAHNVSGEMNLAQCPLPPVFGGCIDRLQSKIPLPLPVKCPACRQVLWVMEGS